MKKIISSIFHTQRPQTTVEVPQGKDDLKLLGDAKLSNYQIGATLGKENNTVTKTAKNLQTKELVTLKEIKNFDLLSTQEVKMLMAELEIRKKLGSHPNIIALRDSFETTGGSFFIISDLCDDNELFDYIVEKGCLTEKDTCTIAKQICSALIYMHKNNIAHRDIKPETIIFRNKNRDPLVVALASFGFAQDWTTSPLTWEGHGRLDYIAPESFESNSCDAKVDCWNLAILVYIMLSGYPPFFDDNPTKLRQKIRKAEFTLEDSLSQKAKDLIRKVLVADPKLRPTAQEFYGLLEDWFPDNHPELLCPLLCCREFQPESPFHKEKMPLEIFKLIIGEAKLGKFPKA